MMSKAKAHLPQDLRDRVQAIIDAKGIGRAGTFLGVSVRTLQVAVLGGDISEGTLALLEKRIRQRDEEGKNP